MAHYAKLDFYNTVIDVFVGRDENDKHPDKVKHFVKTMLVLGIPTISNEMPLFHQNQK